MQNNPSPGNDPGLTTAKLLDALDLLSWARDMASLISECEYKPAGSTAYMVQLKIEEAAALVQAVVRAEA